MEVLFYLPTLKCFGLGFSVCSFCSPWRDPCLPSSLRAGGTAKHDVWLARSCKRVVASRNFLSQTSHLSGRIAPFASISVADSQFNGLAKRAGFILVLTSFNFLS